MKAITRSASVDERGSSDIWMPIIGYYLKLSNKELRLANEDQYEYCCFYILERDIIWTEFRSEYSDEH